MEIFVHRAPRGYVTSELEDVNELAELLTNYGPLSDDDEVIVEITASWSFVRQLLSLDLFNDAWFKGNRDHG